MKNIIAILFLVPLLVLSSQKGNKHHILWVDGSANFERLSSKKAIEDILDKAKAAGVDQIILDLKLISGEVLYSSQYAPRVHKWKGYERDKNFDYPTIFIAEARQRNLEIHASMNVFSEGWKNKKRGPIYGEHPEWQTYLYTPEGVIPTTEYDQGYSAFTNPILPEVREYELKIMREIIRKYDFDGIVLDRARYDNLKSDFSDYSKKQFEKFVNSRIENWPEAIFSWEKKGSDWKVKPGPYYKKWLYWRSKNIHDFFTQAKQVVKKCDQSLDFATYVGAWYPSYYKLGVNWAHSDYQVPYDWAIEDYNKTGYADLLDYLMTGCYFYHVTIDEVESINRKRKANQEAGLEDKIKTYHTVEGSAALSMKVTQSKLPVYGSLYIQQFKDKDDPQQFIKAIDMVLDKTDGIMIFDLTHLEDFGWWPYLKNGLK